VYTATSDNDDNKSTTTTTTDAYSWRTLRHRLLALSLAPTGSTGFPFHSQRAPNAPRRRRNDRRRPSVHFLHNNIIYYFLAIILFCFATVLRLALTRTQISNPVNGIRVYRPLNNCYYLLYSRTPTHTVRYDNLDRAFRRK